MSIRLATVIHYNVSERALDEAIEQPVTTSLASFNIFEGLSFDEKGEHLTSSLNNFDNSFLTGSTS